MGVGGSEAEPYPLWTTLSSREVWWRWEGQSWNPQPSQLGQPSALRLPSGTRTCLSVGTLTLRQGVCRIKVPTPFHLI